METVSKLITVLRKWMKLWSRKNRLIRFLLSIGLIMSLAGLAGAIVEFQADRRAEKIKAGQNNIWLGAKLNPKKSN